MKDKRQSTYEWLTLVPFSDDVYFLVGNSANTVDTVDYGKRFRNIDGMGWIVTCLFIVGETAGGGLIALPTSMVSAGLLGGMAIMVFGGLLCFFTGDQLSDNWTILQERWPEYRSHCRKPYPAMGLRACGSTFATIVSSCLNVTQFGTAVVFLLLAAKNIESFIHSYSGAQVGFCWVVVLVSAAMLPFTLLKSPKDFWWLVIGAMVTTSIAVSLIIYGSYLDSGTCAPLANYPRVEASRFFMCFGTVMFAFGGHGAFPTIQHDMKKPYLFTRSVGTAFLIVFCMYLPVSTVGYWVYGDSLQNSVIPSLQEPIIQNAVNILITLHVILALTIVFNPLNQEWEDLLDVPHEMGIQRVLARTAMMAAVVLVAETVPNFGVLLDLVGGSTITLMSLVFPGIFNLYLSAARKKYGSGLAQGNEQPLTLAEMIKYTQTRKLIANGFVLTIGILGGAAATYSALNAMITSHFSAPCYASFLSSLYEYTDPIAEAELAINGISNTTTTSAIEAALSGISGKFNCCGHGRNISRFGAEFCLPPGSEGGGMYHG